MTLEEKERATFDTQTSCDRTHTEHARPNPYRWVILVAATMTMFTTGSLTYAAGVIHVALLETYPDTPASYVVWVGSVYMFIFGPIGSLGSVVISTFGCRACVVTSGVLALLGYSSNLLVSDPGWLMVTYGILAGSSIGFAVIGSVVIIGYYFTDHIALASGVVLCGQSLGMFVHPPLMQYFVDSYGLNGGFLLVGGLAFHSCVFGMLMRPSKFEMTQQIQELSGRSRRANTLWTLRRSLTSYVPLFKERAFMLLLGGCLTLGMALAIETLYIPDYFHKAGVSKQMSSFAMSVSGIGSCISRLLTGVLAHDTRIGSGVTFSCLNGIVGILTLFIYTFQGSSGKTLAYGLLLGLYTGGTQSLITSMTVDSIGVELSAPGMGLVILTNGVGYLIGPPLSALMFLLTCVLGFLSTMCKNRTKETTTKVSQKPDTDDAEEHVTTTLM